ncbi:membrane protein of ER body-like protein isoform X3 [Olea europaea var. sylvestris]|uniref:membrane protein of ER body-like protein isoform X3 n=1 Tax=Olea europaea var. sylvestris TaxID=158386 RepID=UPI000C1CE3FF|nr:membrane protein of ER body-like protein isoform X3 [Olea europaea var. sylvestris]
MEVVHPAAEALLERGTTSRDDNSTINDTIITDHESSHEMRGDNNGKEAKKSVYLDENAGTAIERSLSEKNSGIVDVDDVPKILNSVINKTLILDAPLSGSLQKEGIMSSEGSSKGPVKIDLVEENEEEILELEFERAVGKMHTHNIYCPNCSSEVTRVILRRKKPQIKNEKQMGLLGCLSCFSIFIPSGNTLNPFRCFGSKEEPEGTRVPSGAPANDEGETIVKKGGVFDLFWIFGKRGENENAQTYHQQAGENDDDHSEQLKEDDNEGLTSSKARARPPYVTSSPANEANKNEGSTSYTTHGPNIPENQPQVPPPGVSNSEGDQIDLLIQKPGPGPTTVVPPGFLEDGSKSLEILKSIVYGGLVETIASLSIVSSAAASETATVNIVALGLANVISGIFVIAHNLRDMKNECPVPDSNEKTDRYQELVGKRENFLFHFTFALLSFLLFGLIPPAVYGLAFEKTGNKDYTIIAVAAASLICIILLSIGKAYCKREHRFIAYFKTILYYISNAVAVSGVAYAMGDLIKILVEKLGWFEPSSPTPTTLLNSRIYSTTPYLSYS